MGVALDIGSYLLDIWPVHKCYNFFFFFFLVGRQIYVCNFVVMNFYIA